MTHKYLKPLHECNDVLTRTDGINYVILVSDAVSEDSNQDKFVGGSGWNVEDGSTDPDFFSMVGGLIEHFLSESDLKYTEKIKLIREFNDNLVRHITLKEDE